MLYSIIVLCFCSSSFLPCMRPAPYITKDASSRFKMPISWVEVMVFITPIPRFKKPTASMVAPILFRCEMRESMSEKISNAPYSAFLRKYIHCTQRPIYLSIYFAEINGFICACFLRACAYKLCCEFFCGKKLQRHLNLWYNILLIKILFYTDFVMRYR